MIDHKVFNDLANIALTAFKDKPTSLTAGQQEASFLLWTSPSPLRMHWTKDENILQNVEILILQNMG